MFKQISANLAGLTEPRKTASEKPTQSSRPASPQMTLAKKAVDRLLSFYPPLDVSDPEIFIAGIVAVFATYPLELQELAVAPTGIPQRLKNLRSLAEIEEVCRDLYAPIERRIERERIANQPRMLPRPRRTAEEQARVDAQVAAWRNRNSAA